MKAAEEITLFYDQEVVLTERICKVTEFISALVKEKKVSRISRLLSHRQTLLDQFKTLENKSASLGRGVFSQWHTLSRRDRTTIRDLRDRIAKNLGEVMLADKKVKRLLEIDLQATRDELQKISPKHALHKKYRAEQENDPRYFRLSA